MMCERGAAACPVPAQIAWTTTSGHTRVDYFVDLKDPVRALEKTETVVSKVSIQQLSS